MIQIEEFDEELFLRTIPNKVRVTTDASAVRVTLVVDGEDIFSTVLYPYDKKAYFIGFVELLEEYCEQKMLTLIKFLIRAESEDSNEWIEQKYKWVVYCHHFNYDHDTHLLSVSYLSTRHSFLLPRTYQWQLSWIALKGETYQGYTKCVMKSGTAAKVYRLQDENLDAGDLMQFKFFLFSPEQIEQRIKEQYGNVGTLLAFTVHRGERAATFYVTDREPTTCFRFCNTFNVIEFAYLYANTTAKTEVDHSEAVCIGITQFYDRTNEETYEVETHALTYSEATWLTEMLESNFVSHMHIPTSTYQEVLISDISCEISDAINATNRIKFTWKYAEPTKALPFMRDSEIFTNHFSPSFS